MSFNPDDLTTPDGQPEPVTLEQFSTQVLMPKVLERFLAQRPDAANQVVIDSQTPEGSKKICQDAWGKGLAAAIEHGELTEKQVLQYIDALTAIAQTLQQVKIDKLPEAWQQVLEQSPGTRLANDGTQGTYRLWIEKKWGTTKDQESAPATINELLGADTYQGLKELLAAAQKSGLYGSRDNLAVYFNLGYGFNTTEDGKLHIEPDKLTNLKKLDAPSVAGSMGFALSNLQETPELFEKARQQVCATEGVNEFTVNMELLCFRLIGDMWRFTYDDPDEATAKRCAGLIKNLVAKKRDWAGQYLDK